jgi:hypothetical protein
VRVERPIFHVAALGKREARILGGGARNANAPSLRCVAEPYHFGEQGGYLGSYFYLTEFRYSISEGLMPSGSLWLNDHTQEIFEVYGEELEPQELLLVGRQQLKLLHSRYPRLERAISSPALY